MIATAAVVDAQMSGDNSAPRYRYVIGALILLMQAALGLNMFAVSPLLPLAIDEYGISRTSASLLVAGPVLVQALTGLPGSFVVGRFGLRRTVLAGSLLVGTLTFSFAADSFITMVILRLVSGAGAGLLITGTGPLIMQWFGMREVPIMNTLFLTALSAGIAVGVLIGAPLSNAIGWQNVLSVFGGMSLLGGAAWMLFGRSRGEPDKATRVYGVSEIRRVLGDRTIFLLVTADALVFIQYAVLTSWLPTYLHEARGFSLERAGYITGLLPAVGILAVLVGGVLAFRFPRWRPFLIVPGIIVGFSGFGSFLFAGTVAISAAVILLGIGTWIYQPTFHTIPMSLPWMTPEKVAVVWGSSMTIAGIGMFIAPIVVGASRDLFGTFVPGFVIWAVLSWSLVIVGVLLPDHSS
jgi:ACS family hexuronate transporter-like MFS transporter